MILQTWAILVADVKRHSWTKSTSDAYNAAGEPPYLAASSSIYLRILSNSVLPVDIKYRICVRSEIFLFLSNSVLACCSGSCRFDGGILYKARKTVRHRAITLCRCRKCSRPRGALRIRVGGMGILGESVARRRKAGCIENAKETVDVEETSLVRCRTIEEDV